MKITIELDYAVGEIVWFMDKNKVKTSTITKWEAVSTINEKGYEVCYTLAYDEFMPNQFRTKDELFASKQELIDSL